MKAIHQGPKRTRTSIPLWLAERYNPDVESITFPAKTNKRIVDASPLSIGTAYVERQKRWVRGFDDEHSRETINQQTCDDIRREVFTLLGGASNCL